MLRERNLEMQNYRLHLLCLTYKEVNPYSPITLKYLSTLFHPLIRGFGGGGGYCPLVQSISKLFSSSISISINYISVSYMNKLLIIIYQSLQYYNTYLTLCQVDVNIDVSFLQTLVLYHLL